MSVTLVSVPHVTVNAASDGLSVLVTSSRPFVTRDDIKLAARELASANGHRLGLFTREGDVFTASCLDGDAVVVADRKARTITGTAVTTACTGAAARTAARAAKLAERKVAQASKAKAAEAKASAKAEAAKAKAAKVAAKVKAAERKAASKAKAAPAKAGKGTPRDSKGRIVSRKVRRAPASTPVTGVTPAL